MNLKDFIKETISEISKAIVEANAELSNAGTIVNPKNVAGSYKDTEKVYGFMLKESENKDYRRPVHLIEFDVAVTATDQKGTKGGIGVMVGVIGLGSQGQSSAENSIQSRLKFHIPVALPVGEMNERGHR
ncbi:hypothetical protein C4544_05350 [candidate division WS5 bacterium]|uniref:Uncharacterized protein n=1 Tax=candidate division WS5 bacterium TaxID=2093353 RepID=A0A419DB34_9BACT|nr:MAG: hypothetical protein C4544_05350 [candidate division WS5 bacterium]